MFYHTGVTLFFSFFCPRVLFCFLHVYMYFWNVLLTCSYVVLSFIFLFLLY